MKHQARHTTSSETHESPSLTSRLQRLLVARTGPLTHELVRTPSRFGLGQLPTRLQPDAITPMVCGFCSTGCSLDIHLREGHAINLSPTAAYPVNLGKACPKGWEALNVLKSSDRATRPLLRDRTGTMQPIDWPHALREFCETFQTIQQHHGPSSVAVIGTGQLPTEELAFLGALAKFGMGIVHCDGNTRQCMATAATAYKQSFGYDAPPYSYADLEESDLIILIGANLCIAHPILWERVCRNRRNPQIVVIDPRRTETAVQATHHLPIAPKGDLALFYAVAHVLIREDWIDHRYINDHTEGFEAYARHVQAYAPNQVETRTGIDAQAIEQLARLIHENERVSFWWTMGVNQSYEGVRTAQAIINLALITGQIGRPGTGANSITGQCNAMGSRLYSNTSTLLGGRDFTNAAHRQVVAERLQIPLERIPTGNSWPYHEIVAGIERGDIRGLWVVGTNTAHSWIDQDAVRRVLHKLEFLVVQDIYTSTETAQLAHLLLPAAGWGEKEGTFINSERRIGVIKRVQRAPGEALADFSIFRLIAEAWGCGDLFRDWTTPEAAFGLLRDLSRDTPCDFRGIRDYAHLDQQGGVQWPCRSSEEASRIERRLFADGAFYHDNRRARLIVDTPTPIPEPPDDDYPLTLLTGRGSVSQWHTLTRTNKSSVLKKLSPQQAYVEMHPDDASSLSIANGDMVVIESRRGTAQVMAVITATVGRGNIFVPMHFEATNRLTSSVFDPHSHQPSYKHCAVRVRTIDPSTTRH